jgi:hypothetical protein
MAALLVGRAPRLCTSLRERCSDARATIARAGIGVVDGLRCAIRGTQPALATARRQASPVRYARCTACPGPNQTAQEDHVDHEAEDAGELATARPACGGAGDEHPRPDHHGAAHGR